PGTRATSIPPRKLSIRGLPMWATPAFRPMANAWSARCNATSGGERRDLKAKSGKGRGPVRLLVRRAPHRQDCQREPQPVPPLRCPIDFSDAPPRSTDAVMPMLTNPHLTGKIAGFAGTFWSDTSGAVLPYVTLMLVVIVGMAALALDGARYMSLQTQLQNGADALALAGAAELDRLPDSEDRGVRAIRSLLANSTLFGAGPDKNVQVADIQFFSRIPATDDDPVSAGILASDPTSARFISVAVKPVTLGTIFPVGLFGGSSAITSGASAVAGFDQVVCKFPPLFVCNPYERD